LRGQLVKIDAEYPDVMRVEPLPLRDYIHIRRILNPIHAKHKHANPAMEAGHNVASFLARAYFSDYLLMKMQTDNSIVEALKDAPGEILFAKFQTVDFSRQIDGEKQDTTQPYFIITRPMIIGADDMCIRRFEAANVIYEQLPYNFPMRLVNKVIWSIGELFGSRPPGKKISKEEYLSQTKIRYKLA